ncbi:hypothetical protein EVAR_76980_1 [Eumeta japonica]|uniref:Uncharacterized protein n=1 Tax=Eumeta variegata TaxID=151549 RepID=A0A4C1SHA5_EUMVA|nr:hypothetical protein EVAR_76980_1 [Eumeta japonica]
MPRKEHIEPATTARDDEHHDGSGIVTRAQAAAAASSDRLVGGTTVPVSDLRDGADPSPCMSAPTATPAPLLAGVSQYQLAALLSTLARSQAEFNRILIQSLFAPAPNGDGTTSPTPSSAASGHRSAAPHLHVLEVLQNARLVLMVVPVILTCSKHS